MSWLDDVAHVASYAFPVAFPFSAAGYAAKDVSNYLKGGGPGIVNSRGDTLSDADQQALAGMTPEQRAIDMRNWMTAGGPPKPIDPSQIFAEDQILSPVLRRSAAGQGINGLFGIGNLIGSLQPMQPIKPLNLSPMQPGVPYSVPPVPGIGGPR